MVEVLTRTWNIVTSPYSLPTATIYSTDDNNLIHVIAAVDYKYES